MKNILIVFLLMNFLSSQGQGIGIGTTNPHSSAALDVQSNSKGVLLPRMTSAQRKSIPGPEPGLMIYDIDKKTIMIFEGTKWGQLIFKNSEIPEPSSKSIADGETDDYFGSAVSMSGDYAVAGAYGDDVNGRVNQGSAYVFHRINGTWVQEAQLFANDGLAYDLFGSAVSISGNYIVVGAPEDQVGANVEQGSVYVFARNGTNWTQQHKFVAPDGASNDHFGFSVSISANQFIVGCPEDDISGISNMGSATIYLLSGTTWAQQIKLTPTGGAASDRFGWSVAINGIFAIVGAPGDDNGTTTKGSAQLYTNLVGWTSLQKLIPSDNDEEGSFGNSVAIDLTTAVVSQDINGNVLIGLFGTGRVYVYTRGALGIWSEQTFMNDPIFSQFHFFGVSVSISGDNLVIGSAIPSTAPSDSAHVVFYKRTGTIWEEQLISYNGFPSINGGFGYAVFINGFNVIIGAPQKKTQKGEVNFINIE